jgi:hypothetical protein
MNRRIGELEVEHVVVRSGAYFVAEKDGLAV